MTQISDQQYRHSSQDGYPQQEGCSQQAGYPQRENHQMVIDAAEEGFMPPPPRSLCILLLGATGVGKSSFIARTTGISNVKVGHDLLSCTTECDSWDFENKDGVCFTLIDTPGFNDTHRDDMDILRAIAGQIDNPDLPPVTGVIYFHRITDSRMTGTSRTNFRLMQALCGLQFYQHIVLSTTMWDTIPDETVRKECESRETQLCNSKAHWGDIIGRGSKYIPFKGTRDSGEGMLNHFLTLKDFPHLALKIELNDNSISKRVLVTGAAAIILEEKQRREQQRREELREMEENVKEKLCEDRRQQERFQELEHPDNPHRNTNIIEQDAGYDQTQSQHQTQMVGVQMGNQHHQQQPLMKVEHSFWSRAPHQDSSKRSRHQPRK